MSLPIIGYDNLLETATLIDDPGGNPPAAGFEKENAADWRTDDHWQATSAGLAGFEADFGSATNVDYFACFGHDLAANSGNIVLEYWNGATWVQLFTPVAPTDTKVIFETFTVQNRQRWRVQVNSTGSPSLIAVIAFGKRLDMPKPLDIPFTPPNLSHNDTILNSRGEDGSFMGRSLIRKGHPFRMGFDLLLPAFVRSDWDPFILHAREKPFFVQWNESAFPAEAAFAWTRGRIRAPRYNRPLHMSAELDMMGLVD